MNKKELKGLINSDLFRYSGNVCRKSFLKQYLTNAGFKYMCVARKCNYYKGKRQYILHYFYNRIKLRKLMYKYGYEIPFGTNIGKGFYIGHFGGVAINPATKIGDNVNISKGVTIGQANKGERRGSPTIGNRVWIGANAAIVGKIKIGDNVLIAPNAYVNFDVPDNSIVIGNPAKVIQSENAVERYIINTV